ncbi:ATP-binding cassette sub-family C member 10-like isoform X1 [Ciona intestinalis]
MENLNKFCGSKFQIWNNEKHSFPICFETIVFVIAPFTLLAATSAYFIGRLRPPDVNLRIPDVFNMRRMCTGLTLVLTIAILTKDVILIKSSMSAVLIISYCARITSLLLHLIFLWRLGMIHFDYKRGPGVVTFSWLLTFPYYIVEMERIITLYIFDVYNSKDDIFYISLTVDLFCVAAMVACQFTYLVTIVRKNPKFRTVSILSPDSSFDESQSAVYQNGVDGYCDVTAEDMTSHAQLQECPEEQAGCLSKLFFCWVQPLMKKGAKKLLNKESSVYHLPQDLNTELLSNKLTSNRQTTSNNSYEYSRLESTKTGKPTHTVLRSLHQSFGWKYYSLGFLKLGSDLLAFAGPVLLNQLVKFVESNDPIAYGCYYAAGLFASSFVGSLFSTHFDYQVNKVALRMKTSLITSIYNKTMISKPVSLSRYTTGEITNFMSTDVNRIVNFCPSFHQFWSLPIQVAITLVLLYMQVGIVFLAGLGLTLIMILFNRYLAKKMGEYNRDMMKHKDDRVKLMTEILLGIRVVKFNAWEELLSGKINQIRSKEMKSLKGLKYFDAGCVYLWATTPVLITLLTFSIYSVTGHQLTAAQVFTVVALINMLIFPLNAFPWVINGLMEAWTSLERLEDFLSLPDQHLDHYFNIQSSQNTGEIVKIDSGCFSWNLPPDDARGMEDQYEDKDQMLKNLNISIKEGELVGVMGCVGSGKSSLLSAISGGMERVDGSIYVGCYDDGMAVVTQEPWLQHATIRENILWGSKHDSAFYEQVIQCCALKEDFAVLPNGDLTEVGENGVTLSGGQKARISLARAVYQRKRLYLLDDPLSAVDQHVAAQLFHECIHGVLGGTTRILCTHHTKYLKHADHIIVMEGGKVAKHGTPSQILDFDKIEDQSYSSKETNSEATESGVEQKSLITNEEKAVGTVALHVYKSYWLAIGGCLAFTILLFVVLMQASKVISDWWLSQWVGSVPTNGTHGNHHENSNYFIFPLALSDAHYTFLLQDNEPTPANHDVMWYLMIYGIIAGSNSIFTLIRAFSFAYGGLRAAKVMHHKLLTAIMKAPISFFDTTPLGRIINRFSSDLYTIDDSLPFMLNIFLAQLASVIGTIIITCYGLPYFALLLLPLAVCYYYTQHYYRLTSRELKRLSSISLSPIYAHFTESLLGVSTIRAFQQVKSFRSYNIDLVDRNQRCNYSTLCAQKWLGIRLQMMGVVMVTGVAFTAVIEHRFQFIAPGLVGLALSYALSVTGGLSGVITSFTETEKHMVAVERQAYYINNVPQERDMGTNSNQQWPQEGAIEFNQVNLKYRPNLPLALENVEFKIAPGEKIGIVGRTGSGKSSLFLVLFGIVPTTGGAVYIDKVNIKKIPFRKLRSEMAIIPQDPFLFSGSLRDNLNPTNLTIDDEKLWWALESCGLRTIGEQMGGLGSEVGERGQRLSSGQRQLLCLARALLRNVKIVCLDEATANIDQESDQKIQETIVKHFARCTVITIAHRIDSVMRSDRVIVMDNGHVIEIVDPRNLLKQPQSVFAQLANQSGMRTETM